MPGVILMYPQYTAVLRAVLPCTDEKPELLEVPFNLSISAIERQASSRPGAPQWLPQGPQRRAGRAHPGSQIRVWRTDRIHTLANFRGSRMRYYFSLLSVIAGMMLVAVGSGLMTIHTPAALAALDYAVAESGIAVTAYAVGMFASCFTGGWLIRRVGHIRAFACYSALALLAILILSQSQWLALWLPLRFAMGFCNNALFMVAQSWLNEAAPTDRRGRIMSLFYVSFTLSYGGGAFLLSQIDASGQLPYLVAAACYSLAAIPVSTTLLPSPALPERFAIALGLWLRRCPVGMLGAFASGATAMTLQGVGAIYGGLIGLAPAAVALMMAGTQVGNLLFQWPLGAISDSIDRRKVLLAAALVCAAICLPLALADIQRLPLLVLCFAIFAGCGEALYALSAAHANDRAEAGDHLSLASTLLVVWSTGATLGPMAASAAMGHFGAIGMPLYFAAVALAFAAYVLWRLSAREAAEHQPHDSYVPLPQSALLADEATLYADDEAVVWEEPEERDDGGDCEPTPRHGLEEDSPITADK